MYIDIFMVWSIILSDVLLCTETDELDQSK